MVCAEVYAHVHHRHIEGGAVGAVAEVVVPAEVGLHAGEELAEREGLGDEVVGSGVEGLDYEALGARGRAEKDSDSAGGGIVLELGDEVYA